MKTKKIRIMLTGVLLLSIIVFAGISYGATGTVTGKTVRIRTAPYTEAEVVTNVYKKDELKVIAKDGDWYQVQYEGNEGYIHKDYIEVKGEIPEANKVEKNEENSNIEENQEQNASSTSVKEIRVKETYSLNKNTKLYILPLISCPVIETLDSGDSIKVIQIVNNWVYVEGKNKVGWILRSNIEQVETSGEKVEENKMEEPKKEETPTKKVGYVNVEQANVREDATTEAEHVFTATLNMELTILEEKNGWYKVEVNGIQGYISKKLVSDEKTIITTSRSIITSRSLTTTRNNVQNDVVEATTIATVEMIETQKEIEAAKKAEEERIAAEKAKAEAAKKAATKKIAIAKDTKVPLNGTGATGSQIVDYAKQFKGVNYKKGGASPTTGFDCSGFTSYIYSSFGYGLGRTTTAQAKNGKAVSKSELQLGDIVVFQNKGKTGIGHVGLYIGNNQFIHAENSKTGVVITSLDSSYYSQRYVCARRIV